MKSINKLVLFWLLVCIPLLSYLVLQKSFLLGLYGDDWLQLYNLWISFDVTKSLSYFSISSYLGPYWPQYFFLGVIRHFWGYLPEAYFYVSYGLRTLATMTLFLPVWKLTKKNLSGVVATLVFMLAAAGLETTDWVFNMNTYAGIAFFNLGWFCYLMCREVNRIWWKYYLAMIVSLTLAIGVVPVRMHVAVPFIMVSDLFSTIIIEKNKINRFLLVRLITLIAIVALLVKVGSLSRDPSNFDRAKQGVQMMQEMYIKGRTDFAFFMLGDVGNMIIPNSIKLYSAVSSQNRLIFWGGAILMSMVSVFMVTNKIKNGLIASIFTMGWIIIIRWLVHTNSELTMANALAIFVGGELSILTLIVYWIQRTKNRDGINTMIQGLILIAVFEAIYWVYAPYMVMDTISRYMIMGGVGLAVWMGGFLSVIITKRIVSGLVFSAVVLLIWGLLNVQASQQYLGSMVTNRNAKLTEKVWTKIKTDVPSLDKGAVSLFYFTTDNPQSAYGVIYYGFWPRAGILYGIEKWEDTPVSVDDYPTLLEYAKTGEPLKRIHGRKEEPVPLSRIYAFEFINGQMISKTDQIRSRLEKDLKKI